MFARGHQDPSISQLASLHKYTEWLCCIPWRLHLHARTVRVIVDGRLAHIESATHRVELDSLATRPVHSVPYRAGPKASDFGKNVNNMLSMDVTEPSLTELATPAVFAPKNDEILRLYEKYCKLNTVTVRVSYPLPRIYEGTASLGDTQVFSAVGANSSCWYIEVDRANREKTPLALHHELYQINEMLLGLKMSPHGSNAVWTYIHPVVSGSLFYFTLTLSLSFKKDHI